MRKPLIAFGLIALVFLAQMIAMAPVPRKSLLTQLNPNYVRAMAAFKRLESKLTRDELRAITTIGILNGAKEAEEKMEQHLIEVVKDLVENTDVNDRKVIVPKIEKIEGQVTRDQQALEILTSAMDLAMGKISAHEFRKEMQHTLLELKRNKENKEQNHENKPDNLDEHSMDEAAYSDFIGNKITHLRQHILSEMGIMKNMVGKKIENTLERIIEEADENGLIAEASERVIRKRAVENRMNTFEDPAEVRMINSILSEADFRHNLIEDGLTKRSDIADPFDEFELNDLNKNVIANSSSKKNPTSSSNNKNNNNTNLDNNIRDVIKAVVANVNTNRTPNTNSSRSSKQEAALPELSENAGEDDGGNADGDADLGGGGGGGGGLVGIITSLSGGEGGSDVGALIGALTGVISTLFGPGGLDIESLISTGTSLISGLLAGNKNFGTVLGNYVGTAFDGLSGGGGAINNGKFIGNFLGTVVASLSADPEGEDEPLKPLLFAENLINSFIEAKNRKDSEEGSEERKDDNGGGHNHKPPKKDGGSDSGAFVKGLVSHLVSQVISVILNASLGVVSGASHASTSLFASSSHHKW